MTRPLGKVCEEVCLAALRRKTIVRVAVLLAALLTPILAFAQNDNWLGGAGNWSDTSKWSTGMLPTSSSNVFIDNGKAGASPVTINFNGAQCGNLTIDSDDSLTLVDGTIFTVFGPTISNAGAFFMNANSGVTMDINGSVTLSGAGALKMSNSSVNTIFGYGQGTGATLTNQSTIQGSGTINPGCSNTFNNQHTVNANQTTPLIISICSETSKNSGTLEATNGGTLLLEGNAEGAGTFDNTGGTIQAGAGSIVQLYDSAIVKNGNLTATSTGATQCNGSNGFCTLDGVTITGTHQLISGGEFLANTITNNGSFQMGTSTVNVNLDIAGSVTLKGTGTLTMSNLSNNEIFGYGQGTGDSLTNQSTIQGSGTINPGTSNTFNNQHIVNANQSTPLIINGSGTVPNTGTLEATNGATLVLEGDGEGGGTFDNTGGTIQAGAGSIVQLYGSALVKNGNLTATSTGATQCNGNNGFCRLDGVTITGTHQLISGGEFLANTITNNGSFQMGTSTVNVNLDIVGSATLKGIGTLTMSNVSGNEIFAYGQGTGASLTNQSTIEGAGTINPGSSSSFINQHVVSATQNLTISGNFSNAGTLKVSKSRTLNITGGLFSNFSGSTLTGGKYMVTGTLGFDGANIVTNASAITLTGSTSKIINDLNAANALANLATNTKTGSLSLLSGRMLSTPGNFSNAGKVTVGVGSGLQMGAMPNGTYTQTAGMTTVDGVLAASTGVSIQAGRVFGRGTIAGTVVSSGSVTAGDSATKAGKLSLSTYTQNSGGSLNIQIGGLTVGTQYSQLAVANGVSLNGTLNIKLINSFVPAIGNTFTIVIGSAISGTFATVNGLSINSGEHFTIKYNPTNVTLTVVSGP